MPSKSELIKSKSEFKHAYELAQSFYVQNYQKRLALYNNSYLGILRRETASVWRANYSPMDSFAMVQSEKVRVKRGLLNGMNFWSLVPISTDAADEKMADAYDIIITKQSEMAHWDLEFDSIIEDGLKLGTGWAEVLWDHKEANKQYWDMKDGKVSTVPTAERVVFDGNVIKRIDTMRVFPDPHADSYFACKYIAKEYDVSIADLKRDSEQYNNKEEYKDLMLTLDKEEYKDKVYLTAKRIYYKDKWQLMVMDFMIQDIQNPYKHGEIPLVPYLCYNDPNNVRGIGMVEAAFDMTNYKAKIFNLKCDNVMLTTLKMFKKRRGAIVLAKDMEFFPGKVSEFDDPKNDVEVMDLGNTNPAVFTDLQMLDAGINKITGNSDYLNAPTDGASVNKTARGTELIVSEANQRWADNISLNKMCFIVPIVKMIVLNIQQFYTDVEAGKLLSDAEVKALKLNDKKVSTSVLFKYMPCGNASIDTKSQKVSKILNLLALSKEVPSIAERIDPNDLADYIIEMLEIPKDILRKGEATPQEQSGPPKASKEDIKALALALAQKTGRPPEQIIALLGQGKTPPEILQMFPNTNVATPEELASNVTPGQATQQGPNNLIGA